jgi:hypothetical protein
MTKTSKLWFVGLVFAAVAVQGLLAMTVKTVDGYGPYQRGTGGEFSLLPSADVGVNFSAYSSIKKTKDAGKTSGTFQSFCLEKGEHIEPNTEYQATLGDAAYAGGYGGGNPDYLSRGTAWLYREFAAGSLAGYDYATRTNVKELQNAIWYMENELTAAEISNLSATALAFLGNAYAANGGSEALARKNNMGAWSVKVLNITKNGVLKQSQLVIVPDGGMTVVLLGMALGGMGLIARRYRK